MADGVWGVGEGYSSSWNSPQLWDPDSGQRIPGMGPSTDPESGWWTPSPTPSTPEVPSNEDDYSGAPQPATPSDGGGGGEEGSGGGEIDLGASDLQGPRSYSGPPDWYDAEAKRLWNKHRDTFMDALSEAVNRAKEGSQYDKDRETAWNQYVSGYAPAVEKYRTSLPKQFLAGMAPMQEYYQPALETMSARGILNSDITGEAIADIQNDINRMYGEEVATANTYAASALLEDLANRPQLAQAMADADMQRAALLGSLGSAGQNALANLVNLDRYSESTNDAWQMQILLPYLLNELMG